MVENKKDEILVKALIQKRKNPQKLLP